MTSEGMGPVLSHLLLSHFYFLIKPIFQSDLESRLRPSSLRYSLVNYYITTSTPPPKKKVVVFGLKTQWSCRFTIRLNPEKLSPQEEAEIFHFPNSLRITFRKWHTCFQSSKQQPFLYFTYPQKNMSNFLNSAWNACGKSDRKTIFSFTMNKILLERETDRETETERVRECAHVLRTYVC